MKAYQEAFPVKKIIQKALMVGFKKLTATAALDSTTQN